MRTEITICVRTRSARPGIGWRIAADGREELEVRVAEAPSDGAANKAVVKLLASALGISRSEVTIISGLASRHKRVAVPYEAGDVRDRLGAFTGKDEH